MYGRVDSSVTGERGWGFKNTQKTFEPDLDDEALKKLNPFVSRRTIREDTPLHDDSTANQDQQQSILANEISLSQYESYERNDVAHYAINQNQETKRGKNEVNPRSRSRDNRKQANYVEPDQKIDSPINLQRQTARNVTKPPLQPKPDARLDETA